MFSLGRQSTSHSLLAALSPCWCRGCVCWGVYCGLLWEAEKWRVPGHRGFAVWCELASGSCWFFWAECDSGCRAPGSSSYVSAWVIGGEPLLSCPGLALVFDFGCSVCFSVYVMTLLPLSNLCSVGSLNQLFLSLLLLYCRRIQHRFPPAGSLHCACDPSLSSSATCNAVTGRLEN